MKGYWTACSAAPRVLKALGRVAELAASQLQQNPEQTDVCPCITGFSAKLPEMYLCKACFKFSYRSFTLGWVWRHSDKCEADYHQKKEAPCG